ncbi:MAG: general stress protein [Alphaproteobacteria bacterium]|nr:general stress protein [Alphaproteobacteria bacterium]
MPKPLKSMRGFASMAPEKQRAIASKGGQAAHAQGRAHKFTHREAVLAGKKSAHMKKRRQAALSNAAVRA